MNTRGKEGERERGINEPSSNVIEFQIKREREREGAEGREI